MPPLVKPRQKFYGAPWSYLGILRDIAVGRVSGGGEVARFEAELGRLLGLKHVVAVPQNRVGLYLVLRSLPKERRNVILSPFTIHDVVNMVVAAGCTPVFADVEAGSANISLSSARELLEPETGAVVVTHLHGIACEISGFRELCDAHGLLLIEDCAQALGARRNGVHLGAHGDVGIFSFGMAKNLNSLFGGAIATNDDQLATAIRESMTTWPPFKSDKLVRRAGYVGFSDLLLSDVIFPLLTFWVFRHGYLHNIEAITRRLRGEDDPQLRANFPESCATRYTDAPARVALRQLPEIEAQCEERRAYANLYREGLGDIPSLVQVHPIDNGESREDAFLAYPVQPPDRDELVRFMMQNGVDVTASHYRNCADVEAFAEYRRECPRAREAARRMMYLPCYPGYGQKRIERNVALIRQYFGMQPVTAARSN